MSGDFFDSNVLLYLLDADEPRKRSVARDLVADAIVASSGTISFQVVQEVLNGLAKVQPAATSADAQAILDTVLMPLWKVMPSQTLYQRALATKDRYRYTFYDSLIIAAALESGATRLYSEDMHSGQRIEQLRIENPFAL